MTSTPNQDASRAAALAPRRFFYVKELAEELRRSEQAVRWLIHAGKIESAVLAGRRVVTAEQLEKFYASSFQEAG